VWLQVPHGSLGKGSGTPKNLARSHVLVAKVLTNSDTHGRIILPRVSVEANLTFLMGYRCQVHLYMKSKTPSSKTNAKSTQIVAAKKSVTPKKSISTTKTVKSTAPIILLH